MVQPRAKSQRMKMNDVGTPAVEEFVEAELAPFAAVAGLFVAAERRLEVGARAVQRVQT